MLVRYPGLTLIAVFPLAVAIGGGTAYFEFLKDLLHPTLPIRNGAGPVSLLVRLGRRPDHSLRRCALLRPPAIRRVVS